MQEKFEHRETLSALLDGEASGDTAKFLARRIERDPEAAALLGRWQFAGDVLRARANAVPEVDLRAALRQQIAASAPTTVDVVGRKRNLNRKTAGMGAAFAMAAALGVVALSLRPGVDAPAAPANSPAIAVADVPVTDARENAVPEVSSQAAIAVTQPVEAPPVAVVTPTSAPEHVRPWRVPEDADDLIARARTPGRTQAKPQSLATVAAVPKAIKRSGDLERVLRGKSAEGALGADDAAQPGWPRAVIPGIDSAFNASFTTGANSVFGQSQSPDTPEH